MTYFIKYIKRQKSEYVFCSHFSYGFSSFTLWAEEIGSAHAGGKGDWVRDWEDLNFV